MCNYNLLLLFYKTQIQKNITVNINSINSKLIALQLHSSTFYLIIFFYSIDRQRDLSSLTFLTSTYKY